MKEPLYSIRGWKWSIGFRRRFSLHHPRALNASKYIPKIILVNGLQEGIEEFPRDCDTLSIFPPVAGGQELRKLYS